MYTNIQKQSSSFSPISIQKKSNGLDGERSFSVGPQQEINSSQEKERPSYSRNAADALIANVMPSMEAREQGEEAAGQKDTGAISIAEVVMPKPQLAIAPVASVSQPLGEMGIQRQCLECQQGMEERKDSDEMSSVAGVQTKLTVGAVGDKYEQEADRVAAQVMSMSVAPNASPQVQRFGEEGNPLQMWSLAQSITPVVQRQVDEQVQMRELVQRAFQAVGNEASGDLESRLNASKGGGSALAPEVRSFMEPRFGADFSSVRVHTGSEAVQMNRELGAQAFAHGSDVYFGAGKSPGNNELTAHELTHVVQQNGGQFQRSQLQLQSKLIQRIGEPLDQDAKVKPAHGETKGKQRKYAVDQYIAMWEAEQGRKLTEDEKKTLARGCIGITALNLSGGGNPPLDRCYSTFDKAKAEVDKENKNLEWWRSIPFLGSLYKNQKAVLFAKMFWSNQDKDPDKRKNPDNKAFLPDKNGKVDMSDYKYRDQPGYINFDYAFWDEASQSFWHANHMEPGMQVYQSTKEKFAQGYDDFDRVIYCVTIAENYDPAKAVKAHP